MKHKTVYKKSVFSHVPSNYSNLLEQKKEFTEKKSSTPARLVWNTNMHGGPFNALGHQHGGHDVSIAIMLCSLAQTIVLRITDSGKRTTYSSLDPTFVTYERSQF